MKNVLKLLTVGREITALEVKNNDGQINEVFVLMNAITRISAILSFTVLVVYVEFAKLALIIGALLLALFFKKILE